MEEAEAAGADARVALEAYLRTTNWHWLAAVRDLKVWLTGAVHIDLGAWAANCRGKRDVTAGPLVRADCSCRPREPSTPKRANCVVDTSMIVTLEDVCT